MNKLFLTGFILAAVLNFYQFLPIPTRTPKLTPLEQAFHLERWVLVTIDYVPDTREEWALPEVTMRRGYGDCEDFALLFLQRYYEETGVKGTLAIMYYPAQGSNMRHAEVVLEGLHLLRPIDLTPKQLGEGVVKRILSYDEAFATARGFTPVAIF